MAVWRLQVNTGGVANVADCACKTMLQHFGLARYLLWSVYEMRDRAYGNNLYVVNAP